jgi:polysaccharide biosynthesis protein PslJ
VSASAHVTGGSGADAAARRAERWLWSVVGVGLLLVLIWVAMDGTANLILGVLVLGLVFAAFQRVLLAWQTMLGLILLVILFIPIRRYTVVGSLPIELEPYRVVIALVLACWFCALAADPGVRLRRTGYEAPMAAVLVMMLLSMTVNIPRVTANSEVVIKQFTFFLSYFLLIYFIVSVIRSRREVDRMLRLLVGGGTVVAALSLVEWRTGSNLFNWYERLLPFLNYMDEGVAQVRGSGVRARGTAQHPIALSAALVMLVPLAVYLYRRDRRVAWLACGGVMTLGALSTGSRTGTTMLIALLVSFLCIKGRETVRLLPALIPLVVVIQIVMPGTLGTMKSLLDPDYVIKEQSYDKGSGAGRVADLGPALEQWAAKPFLGAGFGTRVADPNAKEGSEHQILDDQWLGTLLEVGAFGVLAWLWLYARGIRRLTRRAKSTDGVDGWLATGLAASLISFVVGMLTFDAYAFVQVTFLSFVVLAIGAAVARPHEGRRVRGQAARRSSRPAIAAR